MINIEVIKWDYGRQKEYKPSDILCYFECFDLDSLSSFHCNSYLSIICVLFVVIKSNSLVVLRYI